MKDLKGVFTALVTPFKNGRVDFDSLEKLISQQMAGGIDGFVINGTTAESPTLTTEEWGKIFHFVKAKVDSSKVLILGTGSNSTEKTIANSQRAQALGADAILVVVPYYNKPPQRGLYAHFKAVAESVRMPVLLYNVPGRTVASLSAETVGQLSQIPNIIGIKEATGDLNLLAEIKRSVPPEFVLLSGDDATYVDFLVAGGHGVISVTSHLFPEAMKKWQKMVAEKKFDIARGDFEKYKKLTQMLFVEANPIPVKAALKMLNILESAELRLPLVSLEEKWQNPLRDELKNLHLLK